MKRIIFLATVFISLAASAQMQLGIKAGVNGSNFTGGSFDTISNKTLIGYHAGAFLHFKLGPHFSIQPEALISSQGSKIKFQGKETDYKLTYINIPVMAQYQFEKGLYIEAGPQFGFKIDENTPDYGSGDFANSTDISAALGVGFRSKKGMGIGARYCMGLSNVGNFDGTTVDPDFHNGVWQVSLYYTLFKKKS